MITRLMRVLAIAAMAALLPSSAQATNGHLLHGSGAINAALGGAGVARAFDVFGGSMNPATLAGMRSHAGLGVEFFSPDRYLSSRVAAGAFGPSFGPPVDLAGKTRSGSRLSILPALGAVFSPEGRDFTAAIIFQGVAGFGVDYDASALMALGGGSINPKANPILTPQPPGGFGFGRIFSEYKLMTLKLAWARPVRPGLTFGFALVPAMSELQVDPFPATNPVEANGDGFASYPNTGFDKALGFGFQVGATYEASQRLRLGVNFNSPLWFDSFQWKVRDEGGPTRNISFNLDYPAIASAGLALDLRPDTVWLLDVRRVFYSQTDGFDREGFGTNGAVRGFGWEDIWVIGTGVQFAVSEDLRLRLGYNYNNNPVPSRLSFFNVEAPAIMQHRLTAGVGYDLSDSWQLNVTYYHAFKESFTGPFVGPSGPIPNTSVTSEMTEDSATLEIVRYFGS